MRHRKASPTPQHGATHFVMASLSLNAVRNGFFHAASTFHAARFSDAPGLVGVVGTRLGMTLAAAFQVGNTPHADVRQTTKRDHAHVKRSTPLRPTLRSSVGNGAS